MGAFQCKLNMCWCSDSVLEFYTLMFGDTCTAADIKSQDYICQHFFNSISSYYILHISQFTSNCIIISYRLFKD